MRRLLSVFLCVAGLLPAAGLRVGRARVAITPPAGMPMGGNYSIRPAKGVHDELYAHALVLEKDGVKAGLVSCDLILLEPQFIEAARAAIGKTTGLRGENVMISATHSHTTPHMGERLDYLKPPALDIAKKYYAWLPGKIAESVKLAEANLAPARAFAAKGREESLSFHRRYVMKDGTIQWLDKQRRGDILRPAGPIDPDVMMVYFDSPEAKPLATYVNFAMHLDTTGGSNFSADYRYTLSRHLAEVKGADMLTVFTNGASGNINHVDKGNPGRQRGYEEAARTGTILAADVLKTYPLLRAVSDGPLQVSREIVKLPLVEVTPADIGHARRVAALYNTPDAPPFPEIVQGFRVLYVLERKGKPVEAEVQFITLGEDVAWVGVPGELFVELGEAIKLASPFPFTIVTELANGYIQYIPDRKAYRDRTHEILSARIAPGSGEALVDAATRLLLAARVNRRP